MTSDCLRSTLPNLLKNYSAQDIFNADETDLFYCCIPDKTLAFKGECCSGIKRSKERLTSVVTFKILVVQ